MTLNEVLLRHNFITKVPLRSGNAELPKELKVKLMTMRIELSKFQKNLDEDAQEVIKELKSEEFEQLSQKENKTDEDNKKLEELVEQINDEYNAFLIEKGKEEVTFNKKFTDEDYAEIVNIMPGDDLDINGTKIPAADFLEVFYTLFVE